MKSVAIFGNVRENLGKADSRELREQGKVPCVLYGGKENVHFSVFASDFKELVYTPNTYLIKLDIDGTVYKASLQDMQFHPVNETIVHADFLQVIDDKPIIINIPVKLSGTSPGVRQGGKLMQRMKKLRIKALPANLPDSIEVNIDSLEMGKSVRVSEVSVQGFQILDALTNPIVSVVSTRAAKEVEGAAAPAATPAAAAPAAPAKPAK
jgi:large subunit ribosomal protein L25